ncbi:MAG: hypothetical protein CR980_01860 [Propionibacteriales bacterium]|nr:MAG: hypothetical protein CR980_01860 [Propionibacteriales bacterium]
MAAAVGSLLPALVFGVGFANFFAGIPVKPAEPAGHMVDGSAMWAGSFLGLFTPFTLLGGVLLVALCITHGAVFLSLKTRGEIRTRARVFGVRAALVTAVLMAVFVLWANLAYVSGGVNSTLTWIVGILSVAGLAAAWYSLQAGREGWSFIATGVSIVTFALMVFIKMFGNLGFANMDPANPLNMATAASSNTTLFLMTIAAVIFVPIVIAYQAWSYWVFRRRISVKNLPVEVAPAS